jgi:hypothetical protein
MALLGLLHCPCYQTITPSIRTPLACQWDYMPLACQWDYMPRLHASHAHTPDTLYIPAGVLARAFSMARYPIKQGAHAARQRMQRMKKHALVYEQKPHS